jgi:hypothetical protein
MKNKEISKIIASNIVDSIYDHIDEATENEEQFQEVLHQIKKYL